jgi:hypothetical protein
MFDQVVPIAPSADPYATSADIQAIQDIPEIDVTITRWTASGRPLKLRIRGLDLPDQDAIQQAALVKNAKTGLWEQSRVLFCVETLQRIIRVPAIDKGMAQTMLRKNPLVINALVDLGWSLSAFTDDELEKAAYDLLPPDADAAALAPAGDTPLADDEPLA